MAPRLYVENDLSAGRPVELNDTQAHYLRHVMRLGAQAEVLLFNGRNGEWLGRLEPQGKKAARVLPEGRNRPQQPEPEVALLFAPVKRGPVDFLVQKATELGVSRLQPVLTIRTVVDRVNLSRFSATAVEAAEQCGRLSVPELCEPVDLERLLDRWPAGETLIYCDEGGGPPMLQALGGAAPAPRAILTGPEGGFDPRERAWLRGLDCCMPVSLGPRILRAETAALAALTLWQAALGDWGPDGGASGVPAVEALA